MKRYLRFFPVLFLFGILTSLVYANDKTRIFVLTDIENEPDDAMSLVRFLTYCNEFDVEALVFEWFCYEEPGTRRMSNSRTGEKRDIVGFDQAQAWLKVKTSRVMAPGTGTMHIILAVTDHGTPRLTRYQRVIIDVKE